MPTLEKNSSLDIYKTSAMGMREFLSAVINLSESGMFYEPTCPICISKARSLAEDSFKKDAEKDVEKKFDNIKDFFLSRNEDVSISTIKNHFTNHINQGVGELKKREFVNRLATLNSTDRSTLDRLRILMDALHDRLISTAELDGESRGKELVAISKTMTQVLELRAKIMGEMQGRGEVITIPLDKFNFTFENALVKAKNKEEIELVTYIMDSLSVSDEK